MPKLLLKTSSPSCTDKRRKGHRSGTALVLAALCCLVLIPMIGLAIDGTNVYMMRNQISTALNAAVLAGNRSLSLSQGVVAQTCNAAPPATCPSGATQVAQQTFMANLTGNMSMATLTFSVSSSNHYIIVTGTVNAQVPLMMMGMVGVGSTPITMTATAQRRSVNIMMVLDRSGPMQGTPLQAMQADAEAFVGMFVPGTDNIGLVTYVGAPYVAVPLPAAPAVTSLSQVTSEIAQIVAPGNSYTNPAAALSVAYQQLQTYNEPGALNVIVLFSEGLAGAFTGDFANYLTSTTTCNPASSPNGTMTGVLWSNQSRTVAEGPSDPVSNSVQDTPDITPAPGCSGTRPPQRPWSLLNQLPPQDHYGNATNGTAGYQAYTAVNSATYAPLNTTVSSTEGVGALAYAIQEASMNALDYAANTIRSDTSLSPVIFVLELKNLSGASLPDDVLMKRVANDPSSPYYQSAQTTGQFFSALQPSDLQSAFASIGSQVLRLAQ